MMKRLSSYCWRFFIPFSFFGWLVLYSGIFKTKQREFFLVIKKIIQQNSLPTKIISASTASRIDSNYYWNVMVTLTALRMLHWFLFLSSIIELLIVPFRHILFCHSNCDVFYRSIASNIVMDSGLSLTLLLILQF